MYKLTHVEKIRSPVVFIKPNNETLQFKDGLELSEATFSERYVVNTIKAVDNKIEITLDMAPLMPKSMPQCNSKCNNNSASIEGREGEESFF